MRRRGPPTNVDIANRLVEVMARRYREACDGHLEMEDLRGFALVGAARALEKWNGRGHFEPFAIQRIRWAILSGVRSWVLKQREPLSYRGEHALMASQRSADSVDETPDELTTEPRSLIDQSLWGYRMELSLAEEEAQQMADPTPDVETISDRLRVRSAVLMLPPPEDLIVKRHSYEDESFQEIGDALEMSKSTVSDIFHRGVRRLKGWLDPPPPADPDEPLPPPIPIRRSIPAPAP